MDPIAITGRDDHTQHDHTLWHVEDPDGISAVVPVQYDHNNKQYKVTEWCSDQPLFLDPVQGLMAEYAIILHCGNVVVMQWDFCGSSFLLAMHLAEI